MTDGDHLGVAGCSGIGQVPRGPKESQMNTPDRIVLKHLGVAVAGSLGTGVLAVLLLQALGVAVPSTVTGLGLVGAWFGVSLRRAAQEAFAAGQAAPAAGRSR